MASAPPMSRSGASSEADGGHRLAIGTCPLQLPPAIGNLVRELAAQQHELHAARLDDGPRWLFTNRWGLHPLDPGTVANHLRRHGIHRHAARNTAVLDLATDLPAAVIAPMLGLRKETVVLCNGYARIDGSAYLRARQRRQHGLIPLASK